MLSKDYGLRIFKHRLILFISAAVIFVTAFVLNIKMNQPLYNVNLNQVPLWQKDPFWGSHGFLVFMNVVSNIFNPLVCAGYILLFFLISYRKLQILVFLIWFIFLSWILSLLKMIFHQARPYWIQASGVQMLEWTCYTQFGMPSGHSMMAIILMQFILRFFAKVNKFISNYIIFFYILIVFFQICVMFSRVILGMHSLNQVLLGCLLGCFSFVPYYLFAQRAILSLVLSIFKSQKSLFTIYMLTCTSICALAGEILISLLLDYYNVDYINVISSISGCNGYKVFKSFQYKCLQDSALIMAAMGILAAFNYMRKPSHLNLQLNYTRVSFRFVGKLLITLLIPVAIVVFFINPLWEKIQINDTGMSLIIWSCQVVGFFLATFTLIYLIPIINKKLGFEQYKVPESYQQFKKYQTINLSTESTFRLSNLLVEKKRETQLTETDKSLKFNLNLNENVKPI